MTRPTFAKACALASAFLLAACWSHSFPEANSFIRPAEQLAPPAETVQVFVDANGTFYPTGWERYLRRPRSWQADSLLNESDDDPQFRRLIETDEMRQLAELSAFGSDKRRIFILVHGYNNTVDQAEGPYREIEAKLDTRPGDGIVRFFWDGLTGSGIGGGKIWFNATGYSQLAGSRGLRRVIERFAGKEIYLIGHSRGTSVILSALGNPVYAPRFYADTRRVAASWAGDYDELLSPPPLVAPGSQIHVIAAAPAVDRIDFCDASEQPAEPGRFTCGKFRPLGSQVKSFRYTVNALDPVLNKIVGLSDNFNPTRLGLKPEVGRSLKSDYPVLQEYVFARPERFHAFRLYVMHATFDAMLKDAGILAADGR